MGGTTSKDEDKKYWEAKWKLDKYNKKVAQFEEKKQNKYFEKNPKFYEKDENSYSEQKPTTDRLEEIERKMKEEAKNNDERFNHLDERVGNVGKRQETKMKEEAENNDRRFKNLQRKMKLLEQWHDEMFNTMENVRRNMENPGGIMTEFANPSTAVNEKTVGEWYCLAIEDTSRSRGPDDSVKKLIEILHKFDFEIEEKSVESVHDMRSCLDDTASTTKQQTKRIVVVIAAKGKLCEGNIGYHDSKGEFIGMERIWKIFTTADAWQEKQKIFLLQMEGLEFEASQAENLVRTYPTKESSDQGILLVLSVGQIDMMGLLVEKLQNASVSEVQKILMEFEEEKIRVACELQEKQNFCGTQGGKQEDNNQPAKYEHSENRTPYCVIINNSRSKKSKEAAKQMYNNMKRWNFEVHVEEEMKIEDIQGCLKKVASYNTFSCLIIVLIGTGRMLHRKTIGFFDSTYDFMSIKEVWEPFTANCRAWKGKPKLFFSTV